MRLKTLPYLLRNDLANFNNDNLHLIAISNLSDGERSLERWWERKYKSAPKAYEDHTLEELLVQMYEDYYEHNPQEIGKFMSRSAPEWDGTMPAEHEARMKRRYAEKQKDILKRFQTDKGEISAEEEKRILENLGRNLPNSKFERDLGGEKRSVKGGDEFEEDFATLGGG